MPSATRYGLPRARKMSRMKLGLILFLMSTLFAGAAISAAAAETATLRNGYSIQFDRRELRGDWTRLYLSASPDDFVDVRTDEIVGFEVEGMEPIPPRQAAPRATGTNATDIEELVSAASAHTNLSPNLIKSVIRAESGFNPNAVSPKGAQGLMQLMPQTAARMGVQNALDPSENVEGGARYLRELLGFFHNDVVKALAAYNAGPQRVEQYHGVPPYPETVAYVRKVIRDLNQTAAPSHDPVKAEADHSSGHAAKATALPPRKPARAAEPAVASGPESYFERHPLSRE
jgi:soluble lytic murein transglycosylase-like protein